MVTAKSFPSIIVASVEISHRPHFCPHFYVSGAKELTRDLARNLIEETARSISFIHAGIPTRIVVGRSDVFEVDGFHVILETRDRDTGEPSEIDFRWDLPDFMPSREAAINWIYESARFAWTHELNEAMHLDGKRRRDLHDAEGRTIANARGEGARLGRRSYQPRQATTSVAQL